MKKILIVCLSAIAFSVGCSHSAVNSTKREISSIPVDEDPMYLIPVGTVLTLKEGVHLSIYAGHGYVELYPYYDESAIPYKSVKDQLVNDKACYLSFVPSNQNTTFTKTGDDKYVITEWREKNEKYIAAVKRVDGGETRLASLGCIKDFSPGTVSGIHYTTSVPGSIGAFWFKFSRIFDIKMPKPEKFSEKIEMKKEQVSGEPDQPV